MSGVRQTIILCVSGGMVDISMEKERSRRKHDLRMHMNIIGLLC